MKNKITAFILELICPGFGFMYLHNITSKNLVGAFLGIMATAFICYKSYKDYFQFESLRKDTYLEEWIMMITFFAVIRISTIAILQAKELNKIDPTVFTGNLIKYYRLKSNNLITEEEFERKKSILLSFLKQKGVNQSSDEFLTSLIILKEDNILTSNDLLLIKDIVLSNNYGELK